MYRIAVCDDDAAEVKKTAAMLETCRPLHPDTPWEVETFAGPAPLLEQVRAGNAPDLIFMDIYMQNANGLEAARALRDMGCESSLVFLTTSPEHSLAAFGVDAVQYLVKPVTPARMAAVLDRILAGPAGPAGKRRRYVALEADGRTQRVPVQEIVFCEAQGKRQFLHRLHGEPLCLHLSMIALEKLFAPYPALVRVGKGYILNLDHVEGLDSRIVQMAGGHSIWLPRGTYPALHDAYFAYYTEGGGV